MAGMMAGDVAPLISIRPRAERSSGSPLRNLLTQLKNLWVVMADARASVLPFPALPQEQWSA